MRIYVVTKRAIIIGAIAVLVVAAVIVGIILFANDENNGGNNNVASVFAGGSVEEYEVETLAGANRELPVYCVSREDKKIALTIDAAWEDDKTPYLLDLFEKEDVKATFFLCGFWVKKYPDQVKSILAHGHEIGNHSSTHPHMNKQNAEQIVKELKEMDNTLNDVSGVSCTLFRAPYGEYNDNVIKTCRTAGYEVIQWDVDTVDWKEERSAEVIIETVMKRVKPGSIILAHNNGYKIKEYMPELIKQLKAQGYEFVKVSELLLSGDTMIDVNGMQKPLKG